MQITTRPELIGTFGMVTSTHWLASAAGMAVLEKGGNAFDAAAAAGFVLQIVEPHLNGPGGEVPVIFYSAEEDRVRVLCGQGVTPAALTIERLRGMGLDAMPGTGFLPAVVPGAFGAWMVMLRDYGRLPLADILDYAIGYAQDGFPALPRMCGAVLASGDFFKAEWPSSAAVWLPDGAAPRPGRRFATPQVAETYRRILAEALAAGNDRKQQIERAKDCFYRGFVAQAIERFMHAAPVMDTSGTPHRGLMTLADLAAWQPRYEEPVSYDYAGYRVHKTGPWGQGPVFLQQLALLKGFDVGAMDPVGAEFVHTIVECAKLAFADREVFYGDPDFAEVPLDVLLSEAYNDERRRRIDPARAALELVPGDLPGSAGRLQLLLDNAGRGVEGMVGSGEPTYAEVPEVDGDTVHLDVVDRWGNMVSATPSGGWLQASPAVPELGFCITTRGQMFWLEPELPSGLAPGKRPRTTLTPTLVTRDGRPSMAFGTPGGDQQDQWSLQLFLRHVHHGMNLQAAIDAPMFSTAHFPSSFYPRAMKPGHLALEGRFSAATVEDLERRGHRIELKGDWDLGRLCAVRVTDGMLRAAATPRLMQAYAAGR
jgi:gamma-glutamyltranspeptidase/glutathione hydrolase